MISYRSNPPARDLRVVPPPPVSSWRTTHLHRRVWMRFTEYRLGTRSIAIHMNMEESDVYRILSEAREIARTPAGQRLLRRRVRRVRKEGRAAT